MDIINVCTFAGKAAVEHWREDDNTALMTGLYWRQTFDFRTKELSVSTIPIPNPASYQNLISISD
jgi:hypothetical protein